MDRPDDTSKTHSGRNENASDASPSASQQRIEAQRAQLLQAHAVLRCLYDALLYAQDDDAVIYAQAAHVAANLIDDTAEQLDSIHLS